MKQQDKLLELEEKIKNLECRVAEIQRDFDQMYELINILGENDIKLAQEINRILDNFPQLAYNVESPIRK